MLRIWGRGRHVKKSKIFWGSPKACQKVQDLCPLYVWRRNKKTVKTGQPSLLSRTRTHAHTFRLQSPSLRDEHLFQAGACWLCAAVGSKGHCAVPGCAGDLTARTKQQWPVQKWPKRGLENSQEKEPAVLLITSGCEKTQPDGRTGQSQTQLPEGFLGKAVIFRVTEGLCGLQGEMVGEELPRSQCFH